MGAKLQNSMGRNSYLYKKRMNCYQTYCHFFLTFTKLCIHKHLSVLTSIGYLHNIVSYSTFRYCTP